MSEGDYQRISGFEKNFTNFVVDPLYGLIGLTTEEKRITESDIFRRLRRIKQLGSVSEFYNGATHTRFDHSLGTLHITWMMFRRFVDNIRNYSAWIPRERILSFFSDDTIRALRIAALVHDLGHGPFSHHFESISDHMNARVEHDKITPFLIGDRKYQKSRMKRYYNVIRSEKALLKKFSKAQKGLLDSLSQERDSREQILSIIDPSWGSISDENFNQVKEFLHEIIYGDVGSDRIDYLLRDTHFTGLGHRFNLSDLLNNIAAIYDEENKKLRFSITPEGEDVLDFFLTTRYYHYRLIANNLNNIDLLLQLKGRVENWLKHEKNPLCKFMDLALGDEIYFERTVPSLSSWNFKRIGSWSLGQIRADYDRFLVYKLLNDRRNKKEYLVAIQNNLCKKMTQLLKYDFKPENFRIECIVEKPRIPVISVYRKKYAETKTTLGKDEIDQLSSLIHDDSEMVIGLARTYVAHTTIVVYSDENNFQEARKYTSKTFSFFVDKVLFKSLMNDTLSNLSRLDIMFCCLYCVFSQKNNTTSAGKKNSISISSMNKLFRYLENVQREFSVTVYNFGKKEGYNPEEKKSYPYPTEIINDLIPFEYSGLIKISKVNRWINRWDKDATPKFALSYELTFPKQAKRNFEEILGVYPKKFQKKVAELCERGLSDG